MVDLYAMGNSNVFKIDILLNEIGPRCALRASMLLANRLDARAFPA